MDADGAPVLKFLNKLHYLGASQGFLIKRNDMHGKLHKESVFAEGAENALSSIEYLYRTKDPYSSHRANALDNEKVPVIMPNHEHALKTLGMEMDFMIDERQQQTMGQGFDAEINLDVTSPGFALGSLFAYPIFEHTRSRFIGATKIINEYGILDSVIAVNGKASVSTKNVAYDSESGSVLLTQTTNEYGDPIFNFSYPAHWYYDRMGPAYQNSGMEWAGDLGTLPNADRFLVTGDELLLIPDSNDASNTYDPMQAWVLDVNVDGNGNGVFAVDETGVAVTASVDWEKIKIIRSGRRNLQATAMANVTTMQDPLDATTGELSIGTEVLNASAVEFSDQWQMQCGTPNINYECQCEETTTEASDMQALMNALAQDGLLVNSQVHLNNYPNEFLNTALGALIMPQVQQHGPNFFPEWLSTTVANPSGNGCSQRLDITIRARSGTTIYPIGTFFVELTGNNDYELCLDYLTGFSGLTPDISSPGACLDDYGFFIQGELDYCDGSMDVLELSGTFSNSLFPARDCENVPVTEVPCADVNDIINPYYRGIRGTWRPLKSLTYLSGRTGVDVPYDPTNIRDDGIMTDFSEYYRWDGPGQKWEINTQTGPQNRWQWTAEATQFVPQGQEIESRDPLGRYSAAIFGYGAQVPIAVAANARNRDIAYANFEVGSDIGMYCNSIVSFNGGPNLLTDAVAHTGTQSVEVLPTNPVVLIAEVEAESQPCTPTALTDQVYTLDACDCAGRFLPTWGMDYLLTFWVYGDEYDNATFLNDYPDFELEIKEGTSTLTPTVRKGKLLDGWQRYEARFQLLGGPTASVLEVHLKNNGSGGSFYVDDFRIQPFRSGMQTYAYDPVSLRLMAAMDDHGYATFYQYDQEGNLVGVKQETEKGIQSLNESRNYVKPELN